MEKDFTVFTLGHSTRTFDNFIKILQDHKVQTLVDVRTIPKSRHNPQYNQSELKKHLAENKIEYLHMKSLGGLRHTTKDSINMGWRNSSFRGFADYMQSSEFEKSIDQLIYVGKESRSAIMCSEAVPWRCHRSLIGDALIVRNIRVEDIISEKSVKPHELTGFAKVDGLKITYP